ncbi:MAG: tRNA epoxyqueuosine(34) reductase QueG [Proteobacteria bacterium]|nr:tRNA epoxyqueuosine(34) reductase QueG [Pseudomonadota bacterium]
MRGGLTRDELEALARAHGFDAFGIAPATSDATREARLKDWLNAGHAADMADWMAREPEKRAQPENLWPEVRSVLMLGTNYAPPEDPLAALAQRDRAYLSPYAARKDYHDIIKGRLKTLAQAIVKRGGGAVKVFVDTAPVMEKPLAAQSALGWQGKHSVLVSRAYGNWLFLGAIYTTLALEPDTPEGDHCGSCRACLDACPTKAFPQPYVLDPRACIAYLTIEHKGVIDRALRPAFGNRVFGCDDCLAVCPWNKFAQTAHDAKLALHERLEGLALADLAQLDDAGFRTLFAGTPIKRTGRDRVLRNVMIAIGNAGDAALIPVAEARLADAAPLVRGMAVWALSRLMPKEAFAALAESRLRAEMDESVREEWAQALKEQA